MSTLDDRATALLAKPSVEGLIYALRHPETWPEGFEWYFNNFRTCAMGLAYRLWRVIRVLGPLAVADAIGMDDIAADEIFLAPMKSGWVSAGVVVLPTHIADALEIYLAQHKD
jgi:hypothetical protein